MQLNDILEENSIRGISQKTKISEENLENLLANKFEYLKKVKTLGFISIIEREYSADLSPLREEANSYYIQSLEDRSVTLGLPIMEEKKGKSKFFMLIIFVLLGYATWYFFTQFDRKHLSEMIPFVDEEMIENFMGKTKISEDKVEELSIGNVQVKSHPDVLENVNRDTALLPVKSHEETRTSTSKIDIDSVEITQTVEDISPEVIVKKVISIVPMSRLWFGMTEQETGERDHFSISDTFELDVSSKTWLIATSSLGFSLQNENEVKEFNDAKEHYFKIDKNGIEELSKSSYVALGGWPQW